MKNVLKVATLALLGCAFVGGETQGMKMNMQEMWNKGAGTKKGQSLLRRQKVNLNYHQNRINRADPESRKDEGETPDKTKDKTKSRTQIKPKAPEARKNPSDNNRGLEQQIKGDLKNTITPTPLEDKEYSDKEYSDEAQQEDVELTQGQDDAIYDALNNVSEERFGALVALYNALKDKGRLNKNNVIAVYNCFNEDLGDVDFGDWDGVLNDLIDFLAENDYAEKDLSNVDGKYLNFLQYINDRALVLE